jgi:hypothetical protein
VSGREALFGEGLLNPCVVNGPVEPIALAALH